MSVLLKDLKLHGVYLCQLSEQKVLVTKISNGTDSFQRQKIEWTKVQCCIFNKTKGRYESFSPKDNQLTNIQ